MRLCASAESRVPFALPAREPREVPIVSWATWRQYGLVRKKIEPRVAQAWVQILWVLEACVTFFESSFVISKMWIRVVPISYGAGWITRCCMKTLACI